MTSEAPTAARTTPARGAVLDQATAQPAVWMVNDSTGRALAHLRPAAFTDLRAGRLGIAARPGMRRPSWLATDITVALGADETVTGAGRPGETDTQVAAAWLSAHRIRHLYVQFAWTISHPALKAAAELATAAGCHLWLVGDTGYTDAQIDLLAPWTPVELTEDEFLNTWQEIAPAAHPHRDPAWPSTSETRSEDGWPDVLPVDDFTTFRAACRDRLNPAAFDLVDEVFRGALAEATRTLVPTLVPAVENTSDPNDADCGGGTAAERQIVAWLAPRWEGAHTWQHFLITVRATQAAAFCAGYYIQVDFDTLIGTISTSPRKALRNPATWSRLRAYAQPHRGAACALAAAGMGTNPMALLPVDAYDDTTGCVTDTTGQVFVVEEPARIFLVAQQHLRRRQGATEADLLIVHPGTGRPLAPRTLATIVRQARRELGVSVALSAPDRATPDPVRWNRRFGISVQELT